MQHTRTYIKAERLSPRASLLLITTLSTLLWTLLAALLYLVFHLT
jgi:hypothetical protein